VGSLSYLLSVVDALGWLVGKGTEQNDAAINFQERVGAIDSKLSSVTSKKTVYMELPAGTSPGANTLTQLCFDLLRLNNINTTSGTNMFSDADVVTALPEVIFFDVRDSRTMDQKMRVTT
jgi:ABC-type Fe3+-hydroxamate transport system substrate-binding protein